MKLRSPLPELDGATAWINGQVTKKDLLGEKPVLIHFWSVSCHLCKESMPDLNQFLKKYKDQLNVVAVHIPRSEEDMDLDNVKRTAEALNMTQPIFVDHEFVLSDLFENEYVPSYYVFDRSGLLRHYQAGGKGIKMLEQRVERIL
ncbi:redoxin domain-containing protein [Ureibacillus sp. FSL K6-8385]|uniref:TlpA family protein disulfide reductase n=1 Tax=Ureibacillus sp. FSL K6-8385 TaxID=2954684 RepID=UPI003158C09C